LDIEENKVETTITSLLHFHHTKELEALFNMDARFATSKPKKRCTVTITFKFTLIFGINNPIISLQATTLLK